MAASQTTINEVADLLVKEVGLDKARDIAAGMVMIKGNASYNTSVVMLLNVLTARKT